MKRKGCSLPLNPFRPLCYHMIVGRCYTGLTNRLVTPFSHPHSLSCFPLPLCTRNRRTTTVTPLSDLDPVTWFICTMFDISVSLGFSGNVLVKMFVNIVYQSQQIHVYFMEGPSSLLHTMERVTLDLLTTILTVGVGTVLLSSSKITDVMYVPEPPLT